jgi:CPA2 family monovalent cation:H+ antiporter-2
MEPSPPAQPDSPPPPDSPAASPAPPPEVIIVGFGLPGRFVAEILDARKLPYCVIELNPTNAASIAACRKHVVCGDARDPALLRQAGIESARFLAVTLPDERVVIEVLQIARSINPSIRMMARCNYTSSGLKAEKAGAFAVVVEEQIVALEFAKLISSNL